MNPELAFMHWLKHGCGYKDPRPLSSGRYAAIMPLLYTHAIIVGVIGNRSSIEDRWCYRDYQAAKEALDRWDGIGEPSGWHRHPGSGRRLPDGDAAQEEVRL